MIEPSTSHWSAQVVLSSKKDGSYRYCVDFCKMQASFTVKEHYPVPKVEDMIYTSAGENLFSNLDLMSTFDAFEINLGDTEKSAFSTKQGHWQ